MVRQAELPGDLHLLPFTMYELAVRGTALLLTAGHCFHKKCQGRVYRYSSEVFTDELHLARRQGGAPLLYNARLCSTMAQPSP